MRSAFYISLVVVVIGGTSFSKAAASPDEDLARSVAEFSGDACYGIASGTIPMPSSGDPNKLENSIKVLEGMGLSHGIGKNMAAEELGKLGIALVSHSTMGSKSLEQGDVILAVGGRQPGCRVILFSESSADVTEAVSAHLVRSSWKAVPSMTAKRRGIERRAFVRRDSKGSPYLMNLMTLTTPAPDSKLRMFTMTIRIPDGVQIPDGL
jgi:hypothetical protein